MKRFNVLASLLFVIFMLIGCEDKSKEAEVQLHLNVVKRMGIEKFVAVEQGGADSVKIIYKDKNGYYYSQLAGRSVVISDGINIVNASDYIYFGEGKKKFGSLPGQEAEYKKYNESEYRQ